MTSKTIYLDLDGVFTKFVDAALAIHGVSPTVVQNMRGAYDIEKHCDIPANIFWAEISKHPEFWSSLERYEEADQLMDFCITRAGKENVYFLTSPTNCPHCYSGKAAWVMQHYPDMKNRLFIGKDKYKLANKDSILIDDSDKKVDKFRAHRGKAVLYPRPWNSEHHFSDTAYKRVIANLTRLL